MRRHDQALIDQASNCRTEASASGPIVSAIDGNHRMNILLWKEEDLARRTDVKATEIVANKRSIDRFNQQRNDFVEQIDTIILQALSGVVSEAGARLHSETPGAMIDRLSILALKIHHMGAQTRREDVNADHRELSAEKKARLIEQRGDLADCLDYAVTEGFAGRLLFKAYRQYKMYNDPAFNPHLIAPR